MASVSLSLIVLQAVDAGAASHKKTSWFHKTASHKGAKPLLSLSRPRSLDLHEWTEDEREPFSFGAENGKMEKGHKEEEDSTVGIG